MTSANIIRMTIIMMLGSLFVAGCGHNSGGYSVYNAESSIEGSNEPATITNTVASPAEMSLGDVFSVTFDKNNRSKIDFEGTSKDAQFVLVLSAIDAGQNAHSLQMSSEDAEPDISADESAALDGEWSAWKTNEAFEQQLRNYESELSHDDTTIKITASASANIGKAASHYTPPKLGDIESFNVLNSLSSLGSYKNVQAEIRCIAGNVIFYVDTEVEAVNPEDLTDADISTLCEGFNSAIDMEYELFGEPSDVNGDGTITVLMTPQVNRLGASGGGIITGFFFANDLYENRNSNKREIIYIHVPDSGGYYGVTIPKAFAMNNLLPAVLPHELQHAISYNNKVFVNGVTSEENWLNEALSHFSEDILGFGNENPSRMEVYLNNPSYYGPISSGSPNLAERAASYMFLRYLYEQAADGKAFIWDLIHSSDIGAVNIENSFAGQDADFDQISEFLLRWNIAMVMSSFNLSTDPKFSYKERTYNEKTDNWEGVCLDCNTDDGRGTILSGVPLSTFYSVSSVNLEPTASKFYKVTSFPMDIDLSTKASGTYAASLIRFK